jgi:hypothetical protein
LKRKTNKKNITNSKKKLIFGFILYVLLTSIFVAIFKPTYFVSLILVIGIPSIYNFYLIKRSRKKILLFSIVSVILFAIPVELTCRLANVWDTQTIFPKLFNGLMPIENLFFAFFNFLWVLSFYEYFVDKDREKEIPPKFKILVSLYVVAFLGVMLVYSINPLVITFSYMTMALIVLIIPEVLLFIWHPHVLKKVILPLLVFAIIFFVYETAAMEAGNWWWPGSYLFPVTLFGHTFPLDDILFWYFLSTPALIIGYETFLDNSK